MVDNENNVTRVNLTSADVTEPDYVQTSAGYRKSETHGGEDSPVFASGPMSGLFRSVHEQTHIAYVMSYSACIGPYAEDTERCSGAAAVQGFFGLVMLALLVVKFSA